MARIYSLNGVKSKDQQPGSHRFAVVKALEGIKQGTAGEIIAQVKRNRTLAKSEMDVSKAVHWIIAKMFGEKLLKATKKDPTAKASKKLAKQARKATKRIKKTQAPAGSESNAA